MEISMHTRSMSLFVGAFFLFVCTVATATSLNETFDGVTPPDLPTDWTADQGTNAGGFAQWQTSSTGVLAPIADSGLDSAFTSDPNDVLDNRLYSPSFTYTACARLSFRQNFDLEESSGTIAFDCGVLEININDTGWTDIVQAGGNFETGGYNHIGIETGFGNPLLPSRPNWSGNSGGFITTIVQLPASGAGLPVQLRWRMGSDRNVGRLGWRIDSVTILPPLCATGCAVWRMAAVGDFNPASRMDFLLYNSMDQRSAVWYLNGYAYLGGAYGPTLPTGWELVATGDFNRDGKADYVLYNASTGQTAIWYINNGAYLGGAYGPTLPAGWELVATGDFNRDRKPDYVLYKASTGQTAIWYMNNNVYIGAGYGPTLPAGWNLAGVADLNLDGKLDYLLFNPITLQSAIWYLSNNLFVSGTYGPILPAGWQMVAVADFNGDHKPDYVLYKPATRQTAIWYLNNNAQIGAAYGPTLPCN